MVALRKEQLKLSLYEYWTSKENRKRWEICDLYSCSGVLWRCRDGFFMQSLKKPEHSPMVMKLCVDRMLIGSNSAWTGKAVIADFTKNRRNCGNKHLNGSTDNGCFWCSVLVHCKELLWRLWLLISWLQGRHWRNNFSANMNKSSPHCSPLIFHTALKWQHTATTYWCGLQSSV